MKKPVPPYVRHRTHPIEIRSSTSHNNAFYYCGKCQVWVGWLSRAEALEAQNLGIIQPLTNRTAK